MSTKILCVDDDANILASYQRSLRKQFELEIALGPEEGLKMLKTNGPYAVVVADMQMPSMNGVQFLTHVEAMAPDTVRVMLTGNADQKTATDAVNEGHVFRFLTKPCPPEALAFTLQAGLKQYQLITAERELLENTLNGAIKMLTEILSMLDPVSYGFTERLVEYTRSYAKHKNLHQTWDLELAAMLSQIGCATVPSTLIQKARAQETLSAEETEILQSLPRTAASLLGNIPRLESAASIVLYQGKHYDGSGFPADTVAGEAIPVGARILKVFSDLIHYENSGLSANDALTQMRSNTGYYDPVVLDSAFAQFGVSTPEPVVASGSVKGVNLNDLKLGHVLAGKVETREGLAIAESGAPVSQMLLQKIRNYDRLGGIKQPILVVAGYRIMRYSIKGGG